MTNTRAELMVVGAKMLADVQWNVWQQKPSSVHTDSGDWSIVTNGKAMLAVRIDGPLPINDEAVRYMPTMAGLLTRAYPHSFSARLPEIEQWAALPDCAACGNTRVVKCVTCRGSGLMDHECDCEYCEFNGEVPCEECDDGKHECGTCGNMNPGVLGVPVDRNVLRESIPSVDENVLVEWDAALDPIRVTGSGWALIVMPISHDEPAPVFVPSNGARP